MLLNFVLCAIYVSTAFAVPTDTFDKRDGNSNDNSYDSPPWYPAPPGGTLLSWRDAYLKAERLVKKMTLVEKVNITSGTGWQQGFCVGNTGPVPRLGFPSICLQDGPTGARFADLITAFPAGITAGSTFNKELIRRRGQAMGEEFRGKGINVLLGPSIGALGRHPLGGRNWEGFGSDPYLQGISSAETILGIQSQGVIATVKHFVGNEQEHFRNDNPGPALSSNIDDRTMHEIYMWPFADSVHAGVGTVMCSYQRVNGSQACANSKLSNGYLKDELGFQGALISDWQAVNSGVASALAGLDMMMPGDGLNWDDRQPLWMEQMTIAVLNGSLPYDRLDDAVTRIVAAWYKFGQDKNFPAPNFSSWTKNTTGLIYEGSREPPYGIVNKHVDVRGDHAKIAKQVAIEGTVLLKNDGILPLKKPRRLGVYGEDAGPGLGPNACPDRGCNQGTLAIGWGSGTTDFEYLISPIQGIREHLKGSGTKIDAVLNNTHLSQMASSAKSQDVCLVFVNADSGEGFITWNGIQGDRNDPFLQLGGDDVVLTVAKNCKNTVVVVHATGFVDMRKWIRHKNVKAVVWANLPGQESGYAITDVLFGKANPSGKLPYTIGEKLEDYGPGAKVIYEWPGFPASEPQADFTEGIYIDYRHFDKERIKPLFEFGFGLSYTTFRISDIRVRQVGDAGRYPRPRPRGISPPRFNSKIPDPETALFPEGFKKINRHLYPYIDSVDEVQNGTYPYPEGYDIRRPPSAAGGGEGGNPSLWEDVYVVTVNVKNTGRVSGAEVPQLYVEYDGVREIDFPPRQLRGFDKVFLRPGETKRVTFKLKRRDLSYWNVKEQNWVIPKGTLKVAVGSSSRKLSVRAKLK